MTSRRPVIVLDPGHGGSQTAGGSSPNNARGPNGLLEKDLTLDLARRAAGLLATDGEVFLTRTGDANLPLADRAHAARDRRADVFLSIHLNGFQDPAADGTEVWTARSPSPASRELARLVLQRLLAVTGVPDRGVRESNLGVLLPSRHAANTAASLAEVAFLTDPAHARRLEDEGYRQRIAAALAEGIRQALRAGTATGQGLAFSQPSPAARPSLPTRETPPATAVPETSVYQGRAFTPSSSPAIFRCAPTPVAVAPATQLPAATTTPDPAIRDALRAAGLSATDVGSFERAGGLPPLHPFAEVLGGGALGEVMRRLRYTPNRFLSPPHNWGTALARSLGVTHAAEILPGRLLLAIPGHFRELARSAPDEREAHALESLGWLLMESVAGRVATATGKRWWTPEPPPFVTPFSSTLPQFGQQVHRLVMRLMLIDSTLTLQDFLARFNTWSQGPAGRQWRLETGRDTAGGAPGRPFYPQVVQIPAAIDTAAQRGQIDQAWQRWVQEVETRHGRGTQQATNLLRDCHNERISGLSLIRSASLGGLELATSFPRFEPAAGSRSGIVTSLSVLGVLQPVFELLFRTLHQLGWNDLLFQTAGAACFRGNKVGGDLARQSAAARNISNHGYGSAVDLQVFENPQGQATSTIDPRIVAIFEAFLFRWGRCFAPSSPDPHHFEYCGRGCAPATGGGQSLAAGIGGWGGFGAETLGTVAGAGRAEIDCPVLSSHGSSTRNAILRWNAPPANRTHLDVLVHLHGFVGHGNALDLRAKERMSGCDFSAPSGSPERSRTTLGIIPRGFKTGAVTGGGTVDVYDFPALTGSASGLDQLVQCALDRFATGELSEPAGSLQRSRLIFTAHSGGGARLLQLLRHHDPQEIELFDALYQAPTEAVRWAEGHIRADAAALGSRPQPQWQEHMRSQGGSLRAVFHPTTDTTPPNTALHTGIECALQAVSNPDVQACLRRYYCVERTQVGHNDIPRTFGWQLLADAASNLTPAPAALTRPVQCAARFPVP